MPEYLFVQDLAPSLIIIYAFIQTVQYKASKNGGREIIINKQNLWMQKKLFYKNETSHDVVIKSQVLESVVKRLYPNYYFYKDSDLRNYNVGL